MNKLVGLVAFLLGVAGMADAQAQAPPSSPPEWSVPGDAEVRAILAHRIDDLKQGVGIVVGIIDAHGRRIVGYGTMAKGDPRPVDGRTIFEIGSMTKVFTSLALADMVERAEVELDDPIAKYLPAGTKAAERDGKRIALIDLATHTSGLPRLPSNMDLSNIANPYAAYTADQAYAFLAGYQLPRDPGALYEYSNFGAGLLGHLLARRAGEGYEALVRQRITAPLHMDSTTITLTPGLKARMASGYDAQLQPVSDWDFDVLAGAGAFRSDAEDMLTFLAAELGYEKTPLAGAMRAQIAPRRSTTIPNTQIALGWHITSSPRRELVWHDGGTGGFRSFMAFSPKNGVGVVVLSNAATMAGVDDIALHLIAGLPLADLKPLVEHHAIAVDPATLKALVGRYQAAPGVFLDVTAEDGHLFVQLTGQPKLEVFFEAQRRVFWKVVDAQADFEMGPDGQATAVVLHQNGRDLRAPRAP